MWKMFSITFRSGLRGGIFKTSERQRAIASSFFFVSFTSQHAFTVTLLLPSFCRSSFTPLSQAPLFETFGFFSPYSPFGSSRWIHGVRLVNEGDSIRSKQLVGNFLASFEQIRLFSLCPLHSSVIFYEPAGRSTPFCSTIVGQFDQWHGEFLPSPSDAAK